MTTIWARQALTAQGWAPDVRVTIDAAGRIADVTPGVPATGVPATGVLATGVPATGVPATALPSEARPQCVGILLPAPVNAHSHAFQRALAGLTERRGPDPRDSFWTWRQLMYRFLERLTPDDVEAIAAFVQMEMLEAGFAAQAEFHYLHHRPGGAPYDRLAEMAERIVAAAARSGIGLTLLPVLYQFGGCDRRALSAAQRRFGNDPDRYARLHQQAAAATARLAADARCGVAPHSLRAVAPESLAVAATLAGGAPLHIHLAEQPAEVDEVQAAWGRRPVEWLLENIAVDARWCLVHCTQMLPHETTALAATGAVAGLCPITECSLGDGIFDGVRWLDAGGRIAVGSDSNIRISLTEELRTLEYSQRLRDGTRAALADAQRSTGRRLFDAITAGGAQAAGRDSGRIAAGAWADLLALDADAVDLSGRRGDRLLDCYLFAGDDRLVTDVWSAGRHQVRQGRHIERDAIAARYRRTLARLAL